MSKLLTVVQTFAITFFLIIPFAQNSLSYKKAGELAESGLYTEAIDIYQSLGEYKDSEALVEQYSYLYASQMLDEENSEEAIKYFEKLDEYLDSPQKLLAAKYLYVKQNKTIDDEDTYSYLKSLVFENYKDSSNIYNSLYKVKVEILGINNSETSVEPMSRISKNDKVYVHYKITGGEPDNTIKIFAKEYLPNCNPMTDSSEGYYLDSSWFCFYYTDGAETGTASVEIYDDDGNKLAAESITLY